MDRDETWRRLRSLRAEPPDLADRGDRKGVFSTALEQAEQLIRSAERLGTATKPINLFYGLSQAGRAIAAAQEPDRRNWTLRGHGIAHVSGLDRNIASIRIQDDASERGSFTSMAKLLGSPSLPEPTPLGHILGALPLAPRSASWCTAPGPLALNHLPLGVDGVVLVLTTSVKCITVGWPAAAELYGDDLEQRRAWAAEFIKANYPTLADARPFPEGQLSIHQTEVGLGVPVELPAPHSLGNDHARLLYMQQRGIRSPGGGPHFAYPAVGGEARQQHPLLIWWAALWTLSMLARYEPFRWAKLIDVDKNSDATALEYLLDAAPDHIPSLVFELLRRPPGPDHPA